jgi:hypothetical protein
MHYGMWECISVCENMDEGDDGTQMNVLMRIITPSIEN